MKIAPRRVVWLFLCLAFSFTLAAAPGKLTPTGPFGGMDFGVRDLVFPGTDPQRILIRTDDNLFESRDAGASWRSVLDNWPQIRPDQLVTDPANPDRWYVIEPNALDARIWQTADAGLSWTPLPMPLPQQDPSDYRLIHLYVDAADTRVLALEIASVVLSGTRRYYSVNRGDTWTELDHPDWHKEPFLGLSVLLGINDGIVYSLAQRYDLASGAFSPVNLRPFARLVFDRVRRDTSYMLYGRYLLKSSDRAESFVLLRDFESNVHFFTQSPWNPSHLAASTVQGLSLSLDRGISWVTHHSRFARDGAFDPASGELLLAAEDLVRRRLDGSFAPASPLVGLDGTKNGAIAALGEKSMAVGFLGNSYFRDGEGIWQQRGDIRDSAQPFSTICDGTTHALFSPEVPGLTVAVCGSGTFTSRDGGWTWSRSATGPPAFHSYSQLASSGSNLYLVGRPSAVFHSPDFGSTWQTLAGDDFTGIAADPSRGLLAVKKDGALFRYLPATGWQTTGAALPGNAATTQFHPYIVGDPAHPNLLFGLRGGLLSRSLDFGANWEIVSDLDAAQTYLDPFTWKSIYTEYLKLAIDPFDADHLLFLMFGLESRDGGRTFSYAEEIFYGIAAFDPLTPGRLLVANDASNGVLERTATLPACTDSEKAWCARGGRYLLTVDWKDPLGNKGRATKVVTGSEDSGLFYFFDSNNWELLVKVLDGCGINQRQWLFAAGTTDVEYQLRVEDRWTGQIRHYFNPAGQAAAAITDTDAFAGCGATPPPGAGAATFEPTAAAAAAGEEALPLVNGRFEARVRWTNFAGQEGDGLTAPLSSDNSGLFFFFSPNNWEMLVKVLNGCAINGHYWMLAAATTDVGYELTLRDTTGAGAGKTYRNPVGRAAPAQIDLQAFSCQ